MQTQFQISTNGAGLFEITRPVAQWVAEAAMAEAALTLFVRHTSASLLVQENADPAVQDDLAAWMRRLVPPGDDPSMAWLTHTAEGPDDMPAHIKAALLPVSITIPTLEGRLGLGTWQGIYLFEHRTHPHRREVMALLR